MCIVCWFTYFVCFCWFVDLVCLLVSSSQGVVVVWLVCCRFVCWLMCLLVCQCFGVFGCRFVNCMYGAFVY